METIRSTQAVQDGQVHVTVPAEWANEVVEIFVTRKSKIMTVYPPPKSKEERMAALERFIGSKKPLPGQPSMMVGLMADRNEDL